MMTAILASTDWLRSSPHAALWIICMLLPLPAACCMLISDEEQRHQCVAFVAAMLVSMLLFILTLNLLDWEVEDLLYRRWLPSWGRRRPDFTILILGWIFASYILSRGMLHLYYKWRDRASEQSDAEKDDE